MSKFGKTRIIVGALLVMLLTGCGRNSEIIMREFSSADRTVSLRMDESWNAEDMGKENWIAAFNDDKTEGIVVMQMPKKIYSESISDIVDLKSMVEETFDVSDAAETDKPEIPNLGGVEAYKGTMNLEDASRGGFIVYGETDYAYYSLLYASTKMDKEKTEYFNSVCETLKETAPEVEEISEEAEEAEEADAETSSEPPAVSNGDVLLWFNATCAVQIKENGRDYTVYGGLAANEDNKAKVEALLLEEWSITDRASADKILTMLKEEGHRIEFETEMNYLKELGVGELDADKRKDFMTANFTLSDSEAQIYADWYTYYEKKEGNSISAWDYSRAMMMLADCYIAGYYTKEEALDASLEIAKTIQSTFDSWDSFMESYLVGYEFWSMERSDGDRTVYEELKAAADSPYNQEWNMSLEKSW